MRKLRKIRSPETCVVCVAAEVGIACPFFPLQFRNPLRQAVCGRAAAEKSLLCLCFGSVFEMRKFVSARQLAYLLRANAQRAV